MIDSSLNAWSCMALLPKIFAAESSSAQQIYYSGGEAKNPSYMIHRRSIWFLMVHRFIILSSHTKWNGDVVGETMTKIKNLRQIHKIKNFCPILE